MLVTTKDRYRISKSIQTAIKEGKGIMMALDENNVVHHFSKYLMDPETGISYDEPAPNTFSFNSPYGACPRCNGLGTIDEITEETISPIKISVSAEGE